MIPGMPPSADPLPRPLVGVPFRTRDAQALGVPYARLRRVDLVRPVHGVRSSSGPDDVRGREQDGERDHTRELWARCRALAAVMDERHAFAHVTALRLLGADIPDRFRRDDDLHVVTAEPAARIRRPGVVCVARGGGLHVVLIGGLRVAAPGTTFVHCAADLGVEELVVLGDALTRRDRPVTDLSNLTAAVREAAGCRGIGRARIAVGLVVAGTDSVPETWTRRLIERHGFPRPAVNMVARDDAGRYLARPDLSYPELRIAIEYDGDYHRTDRRTWQLDVERRQRLEDAGWRILTVTAATLRDPTPFLTRLEAALTLTP